jgi:hypothetical protein
MYDVVIVILIGIVSALLLAKRIINDRNKSQIKKKRFFYYEEEGFFSRIYEIRVVYGILISLILGCAIYVYFRLSGKLENIFPDFIDYYGL